MSVETRFQFDAQTITQLSQKNQEPEWLLAKRQSALKLVEKLPLPKLEKTNIENWNFTQFQLAEDEAPLSQLSDLPQSVQDFLFAGNAANVLIQKNGSIVFQQNADELKEQGVIFTDLATAAREHGELVKKYFMTEAMKADEHRLAAIHAALTTGGVFLYVPRNVEVKLPFQGLFWVTKPGIAVMPHVLIIAEANSRVEFVASFVAESQESGAVNNAVVEVFAGDNAEIRVATINNLSSATTDVIFRRAVVGRDAKVEWIIADLSEGRLISNTLADLKQPGGNVLIKSVALGTKDLRANVTSELRHIGMHTTSDIHARAVMKDDASSILNSITKIEKGARKADGQQTSRVLMLSGQARGDANPILLIDENDVIAGHAASVGRIDPMQLYYLMSRGIPKAEAERLIIYGFLDAVISEIPSESLRKTIHRVMERKLGS